LVAGVIALVAASPAVAVNFEWTGATPLANSDAANWSNSTNWDSDSAPTGTVGTLSFPALPSCDQSVATCYVSYNDLLFLRANAVSIDDGVPYDLPGIQGFDLGSGGLSAAPSPDDTGGFPVWDVPIYLAADQTWSITGGPDEQGLEIDSQIFGVNSLAINLADGGFLALGGNDDIGPITVAGDGELELDSPLSLNGITGSSVSFGGGAVLAVDERATVGPLTLGDGELDLGFPGQAATLAVHAPSDDNGTVTLGSSTVFSPLIAGPGQAPGTDFSQLTASGAIDLGGAQLALVGQETNGRCVKLNVGDVITVMTTTGSLTGTFDSVPDGTVVPVDCLGGVGVPPTVRINYTANGVTATVVTSGDDGFTTTILSASPTAAVTNQTVTLTASVDATPHTPDGTVTFDNQGSPISGCSGRPLVLTGSNYTATCQTSFAATSSPESLTASFAPSSEVLQASTSSVQKIKVGLDSASDIVSSSNNDPVVGASITLTSTVMPSLAGPTEPSGTVTFYDYGSPIAGCSSRTLTSGTSSSTATCTVDNPALGRHSITAIYGGDANFVRLISLPYLVTVSPVVAPRGETAPWISGASIVGKRLVGNLGEWSGTSPILYGFQWQRCTGPGCTDIVGATASSYRITSSDVDTGLRVRVTARNATGAASAVSDKLGPVLVSGEVLKALLQRQIKPHGRAATLGRVLASGHYSFVFEAPEAGTLRIRWYLGRQPRQKPMLVASGSIPFRRPASRRLRLTLTRTGKRQLANQARVSLIAVGTFTARGGGRAVITSAFRLDRT